VLGIMLSLALVQPALAMIFLVTDTYDATDANPGDGLCADAGGRCTLRAAVQESNALSGPHIIVLPEGTYTLSIPGNAEHAAATGDLDLLAPVTIRGQGPDRTVIDAGGIDRAFEAIHAGAVTIRDLTIENGVAGANTPGYFAVNSGGAISAVGDTSTLTLRNVVLRNNQAQSGGGLYNVFSTVVIENSTLHDNAATSGSGGGIAEGLAAFTRLYNVTLSGNRAAQNGGGMATSNNTALLHNVTITGNLADSDANGSGNGGGVAQGITAPTLFNSIIAGNSDSGGEAPDCAGSITSNGYNLIGDDTGCTVPPAPGDQIGTAAMPLDPELQALAVAQSGLPVHALNQTSPAIDAGNPAIPGSDGDACLDNDARGANRTLAMPCDIGAYEVATFGQTFTVNSLNDAVDANPGDGLCETATGNHECTLRAAIQEANALFGTDTIEVPAGTIVLTLAGAGENLSASGDLDITDGVRILGAGMDQTIIDGGGLDRVFHLSTTARIEMQGLTIRNGVASGASGGGILLENTGGLDLTDVRITGNSAQSGGGVYAALWSWMGDDMINVTRCIISDNTANSQGGGFANFTFRTSRFVDSTLSGNSAQYGGGLFNSFMSMALVSGSTISANQAQYGGGITLQFGRGW
jgi:large repetitive protein